MALTYHSARRGFLGFLTYLTGSDGVSRGGVIPAVTLTDSNGTEITSFGGGGAMTVADGANVAEGATTDAVVAAGAAGSISAKLRRLTTDLAAFATANHTDLTAATPAGTNLIGKLGFDQTTQGTTNLVVDSGLYTAAPGTLSTGSYSKLAIDVNSNLQVRMMMLGATIGDAVPAANVGLTRDQANTTNLMMATVQNIFNGTSYDRLRKTNIYKRVASSAASGNPDFLKASAGDVTKFWGLCGATAAYLQIYNKASAPTVGTDVPVLTYPIIANSPFTDRIEGGGYFSTGIAFAFTTDAAGTTGSAAAAITAFTLMGA